MPSNRSRVVPIVMTCHKSGRVFESERLAQLLEVTGNFKRRSIVRQEFDCIQEYSFPPNDSAGTDRFVLPWWAIRNFDLGSYGEIRSCKQVHAVLAHVDSHAIHVQLTRVDPNGNGDPLTR